MEKITVKISVKATIEDVWKSYTNPEHIVHWNFASDEWCCPKATNNLTEGGTFNWRMESKDGKMGFDFNGTYQKITDNALISYSIEDGRNVDIKFAQHGDEVTITQTFDVEGTHSIEQQRAGWQAILENFKAYVEFNT